MPTILVGEWATFEGGAGDLNLNNQARNAMEAHQINRQGQFNQFNHACQDQNCHHRLNHCC